jgi:hypothetical protein
LPRIVPSILVFALLALGVIACSERETTDTNSPRLAGPASGYVPGIADLDPWLNPYPPETFVVTRDLFPYVGPFSNPGQGEEFMSTQGFEDGYHIEFEPDGLLAGVAGQGQYYLTIETFLFTTDAGARALFERYQELGERIPGSEPVEIQSLANQSGGWELLQGTVGASDQVGAYHRFIFRRGNMVAVVQTYGAMGQVSIETAREIAVMIDNRARGVTPAATPTPRGG